MHDLAIDVGVIRAKALLSRGVDVAPFIHNHDFRALRAVIYGEDESLAGGNRHEVSGMIVPAFMMLFGSNARFRVSTME